MEFTVSEVASWIGGRVVNAPALGPALERIRVLRLAELADAGPSDLAYFFRPSYQKDLIRSSPGVLITGEPFVKPLEASGLPLWKTAAVISCADPYLAMALISERMAAVLSSDAHLEGGHDIPSEPEIHPSAVVHSTAELGAGVRVGPHCVIERGARIGDGTWMGPGCYVGVSCSIGKDCVFFPRVTLYEWTQIGNRVRLHAGVVLGADGFGYAPRKKPGTDEVVSHAKIFHLGRVVIGDDVEIGANSCVDRATLGATWIGAGAKVDDLVIIGHNCRIEEGAVICGSSGLAGRARVGKFAYLGGGVGLINDVYVGERAEVGAHTLISKDVPPGTVAVGNPQRDHQTHFRVHAMLNRLLAERSARSHAGDHVKGTRRKGTRRASDESGSSSSGSSKSDSSTR